jgi:cytochrome c553
MIKSTSESNIPVFIGCHSNNTSTTSAPIRPSASSSWAKERKRSLIPRYVGSRDPSISAGAVSSEALSGPLSEESLDQLAEHIDNEAEEGEPRPDSRDLELETKSESDAAGTLMS